MSHLSRLQRAFARARIELHYGKGIYHVRNDSADASILLPASLPLEEKAVRHLLAFASVRSPRDEAVVCAACATPHFHPGAIAPVGSIVATQGDAVIPAAIGTDINCGMRLLSTGLSLGVVAPNRARLIDRLKSVLLQSERDVPVVSIVGYTNAGKSTLLNVLTKSDVFVEQRMFATLDPSSRRLRLPREREVVINDTVGFIRDLPKDLLAAFRATLEEIADSDLLVHLVDMSHLRHDAQIKAVEAILAQLGDADIPRLLVFNKADLVEPSRREEILLAHEGALAVSAVQREGLATLLKAVDEHLASRKEVRLA